MNRPFIRVLGSADWHPTANNDNSCYTVSDQVLIDCCPSVVTNLLGQGVDPIQLNTICFTHMHADHCLGLPSLLLYWRIRKESLGELTLVGPKATLRETFEIALHFAFHDSDDISEEIAEMPKFVELEGDAAFELPGLRASSMDSDHAVPGTCYRLTDEATGRAVGFTGDTRYLPAFGKFFDGVDMLVHEASFGAGPLTEFNEICRHSSAREAVQVCREARVKKLLLTHCYEPNRDSALAAARASLSIPVEWAMPGQIFEF